MLGSNGEGTVAEAVVVVVAVVLLAGTATHTSYPSHKFAQVLPTYGFQALNCAAVIPKVVSRALQVSPDTTVWYLAQGEIVLGNGEGWAVVLGAEVLLRGEVGVPGMPTQTS